MQEWGIRGRGFVLGVGRGVVLGGGICVGRRDDLFWGVLKMGSEGLCLDRVDLCEKWGEDLCWEVGFGRKSICTGG